MKHIFNQLPGLWTMERHIQNMGNVGLLKGTCHFSIMDDGRLLCDEQGELDINGQKNPASRSYIYEYRDDKMIILYNDPHREGDVLHELEFSPTEKGIVATHCHLCGQDTYDLQFSMISDTVIQMDYVVKGPHKDYAMQTILTRQDPSLR